MITHNIISFDFGLKRIGVAIGQNLTKTARPLTTIAAKNGVPDWKNIEKIINKWQPAALIVGIPLNMDGSSQPLTQKALFFTKSLREKFHLPVYEADERLTTKDAKERLFSIGGYKALQEGEVDKMAAKLILENWFLQQEKK